MNKYLYYWWQLHVLNGWPRTAPLHSITDAKILDTLILLVSGPLIVLERSGWSLQTAIWHYILRVMKFPARESKKCLKNARVSNCTKKFPTENVQMFFSRADQKLSMFNRNPVLVCKSTNHVNFDLIWLQKEPKICAARGIRFDIFSPDCMRR